MAIECTKDCAGKIVCKFVNRMDTAMCMEAEKEVMKSIEGASAVTFDLAGVEYIASSFLRLCGKASHKVTSDKFSIINVSPAVKKVFKIAGLAERLNLE